MAGGIYSAIQQRKAGEAAQGYYSYLASNANTNAELATAAGESQVKQIGAELSDQQRLLTERKAQAIGTQKATIANGAGLSSRTGQDILLDTARKSELDQEALNFNADSRARAARLGAKANALNLGSQALGDQISGQNALRQGNANALSTILGTGTQVASTWYSSRTLAPRGYTAGGIY